MWSVCARCRRNVDPSCPLVGERAGVYHVRSSLLRPFDPMSARSHLVDDICLAMPASSRRRRRVSFYQSHVGQCHEGGEGSLTGGFASTFIDGGALYRIHDRAGGLRRKRDDGAIVAHYLMTLYLRPYAAIGRGPRWNQKSRRHNRSLQCALSVGLATPSTKN